MSSTVPALERRRSEAARLVQVGRLEESLPLWRDEAVSGEDGAKFVRAAAVEAMAWRDLRVAGALAEIYAAATWRSSWWPGPDAPAHLDVPVPDQVPRPMLSLLKLEHDLDQIAHLRDNGLVGPELDSAVDALAEAARRLAPRGPEVRTEPTAEDHRSLGPAYNRILHFARSERLPAALGAAWDRALVQSSYLGRPPGIVVIDDFLSPEALHEVRRFCLESTVWSATRYSEGRLGALFVDGFNTPLLLQIAEEIRTSLPRVIGDLPLRQLWAFKAPTTSSGAANTHADFAAVNLNFWVTPTESNLDPSSGGLIVYDATAPLSWQFATYNEKPDLIDDWLRARGARAIRIPYRQNRAILFNSDLFHATEPVRFRAGYEHRRLNITLLYGDRAHDVHHPASPDSGQTSAASAFRAGARSRLRR